MKKPCTDHLGQPYPSVPDMCAAYGISPSTYTGRLERGWTQAQALTTPSVGNGPKVIPRGKRPAVDHEGNEFPSIGAMCRHWGLSEKVYWSRKRLLKWPLDKILTTPVRDPSDAANAIKIQDHLGGEFASISEMCRHWGIGLSTYRERRKRGWDIERSLTEKQTVINTDAIPCTDHLGNPYPSKNAMCAAYGTTRYCYESRLDRGWTQAQALTGKNVVNAKPCADHAGRTFPATSYMALYLGFPKYAFHGRKQDPEKLIPSLAAKHWAGRNCGRWHVESCIAFPWFLARYKKQDCVLHFETILEAYHSSEAFTPLPETGVKNPSVSSIRLLQWPWYLCRVDGATCVMDYWQLIRKHAASGFGISAARTNIKQEER